MSAHNRGRSKSAKHHASPWLKDTGSTWHTTNDKTWFTKFYTTNKKYSVEYGDKSHETAEAVGEVRLQVRDDSGDIQTLVLDTVLYLPNSGGNVFSSQWFVGPPEKRSKNEYWASEIGTKIKRRNKQWITMKEVNGSAYLEPINGRQRIQKKTKRPVYPSTDARYWHQALGHISKAKLLLVQRYKLVEGMPLRFTSGIDQVPDCEVCWATKSQRKSNKSNKRTSAKKKFEIVSSDLLESNVLSLKEKCKWAVVYVDHYTRMKWVYGIRRKSDTYRTLQHFVDTVVHPAGGSLGTMMTDNGGEFLSEAYQEVMTTSKAYHRYSPPYTQSSNGIAERAIGSLTRMTRAMLKSAGRPATWWLWAIKTAAYIHNRVPTKGLDQEQNETPYERFYDKKPDVGHIKPFGAKMWMLFYNHQRHKFDDTSRETVFVGYPEEHDAQTYRGFDEVRRKVYTSRHVRFVHDLPVHTDKEDDGLAMKPVEVPKSNSISDSPSMASLDAEGESFEVLILRPERQRESNERESNTSQAQDETQREIKTEQQTEQQTQQQAEQTDVQEHQQEEQQNHHMNEAQPGEKSEDTTQKAVAQAPQHQTQVRTFEEISNSSSQSDSEQDEEDFKSFEEELGAEEGQEEETEEQLPRLRSDAKRLDDMKERYGEKMEEEVERFTQDDLTNRASAVSALEGVLPGGKPSISAVEAEEMIRGFVKQAVQHIGNCACYEGRRLTQQAVNEMRNGWKGHNDLRRTGLCCSAFNSLDIRIPKTRREALSGKDKQHWMRAEREEMESMLHNNVYSTIHKEDLPEGTNICQSRFVYDVKTKADGTLEKYKVRWVAKGFSQKKGKDYWETFSPVVRMSSVRTLLSIATAHKLQVRQCDIKTAFLEADLREEIHVAPPEGAEVNPGVVYKLHKALYGLKQSSREFNLLLTSVLRDLGYRALKSDSCIMKKVTKRDKKLKVTLVGAYVDDLVITGNDNDEIEKLVQGLQNRFRVKDLGNLEQILGCHWERRADGTSIFKQTKTIEDMIKRFRLNELPPVATPGVAGEEISKDWCPEENSDEHKEMNMKRGGNVFYRTTSEMRVEDMSYTTAYRAIVGSLLWIARCTRPDIMHTVCQLSRFMQNPGYQHMQRAKRAVQYLAGTRNRGIVWHPKGPDGKMSQVITYSDSSFADQENAKSTYGYLTCLNGGPVDYASKVQLDVAHSTCESEYVAMSKAIVSAVAMSELLTEMEIPQETVAVHCDNTAAIAISAEDKAHMRTRAIKVRYHHIRDEVAAKLVSIHYLSTNEMPADLMTKSLARRPLEHLRDKITGT